MLFAGLRSVRMVKTVTSGLKMLPSACGLGQHFQDLGHSFLPYGPPSRQITYIYYPTAANTIQITVQIYSDIVQLFVL